MKNFEGMQLNGESLVLGLRRFSRNPGSPMAVHAMVLAASYIEELEGRVGEVDLGVAVACLEARGYSVHPKQLKRLRKEVEGG